MDFCEVESFDIFIVV